MLKQGELRGLSVRVRAVAALLSVFSLRALALVSPSFQVNSSQAVILRSLRVNRLATDSGKAFAQVDCVLRFEKFVLIHIRSAPFNQRLNLVGRQQRWAPSGGPGTWDRLHLLSVQQQHSMYVFDFATASTNFSVAA